MDILPENSFLFQLSPSQLDSIGDDLRLKHAGYKFYYAVDTYDFVHFFMPYLNKLNFSDERINVLAQEAVSYEGFFNDIGDADILLLQEYKQELMIVKDLFFEKVRHAHELKDNLEDLVREILLLIKPGSSVFTVINKNFELFFLSLIMARRKEDMKELSFLKFLSKKIHIKIFETGNDIFDNLVNEAIEHSPDKEMTAVIYDWFIDRGFDHLKKYNKKKLYIYLENTYNDIAAFQRILSANESIYKQDERSKTIVFYYSSAPFKSSIIADIVNEKFRDKYTFHSVFHSPGTGIHRNNFQIFLLNILDKQYPNDLQSALDIIEQLKEVNSSSNRLDRIAQASGGLNSLLIRYSSMIENHFYRGLIDFYKGTLNEIINTSKEENEKRVMSNFKEFLVLDDRQKIVEQDINYNLSKIGQIIHLKNAIKNRLESVMAIRVKFGKDIIRFNFHHLPYLLFLYDGSVHEKFPSLYSFLQAISNIENENANSDDKIIETLNMVAYAAEKGEGKKRDRTQEFLILTYIDLLEFRNIDNQGPDSQLEIELIDLLQKHLMLAEKMEDVKIKKKSSPTKIVQNPLIKEIVYMLLWLYRRNNLFQELADLEKKLVKENVTDPRLLHGLGIGAVSKYYHEVEGDGGNVETIRIAIKYLSAALLAYQKIYTENKSGKLADLILKAMVGVCNAICDAYLVLFGLEKTPSRLENGRKYLVRMKDFVEKTSIAYNELPIPNMTEAELEAWEAELLLDRKEIKMAKKKFEYARKRYRKAIEKGSLMHPRFGKKVSEMLDALEHRIYLGGKQLI